MTHYVMSGTLTQAMESHHHGNPIPGPIQLSWALQLLDGLIHLHRIAGVPHCCLKPDNILIDKSFEPEEVGG